MIRNAIAPIERVVHATNAWLKELADELGWADRQRADHALGAVLRAMHDPLTVAEASDLGAHPFNWTSKSVAKVMAKCQIEDAKHLASAE